MKYKYLVVMAALLSAVSAQEDESLDSKQEAKTLKEIQSDKPATEEELSQA